jgi:glyoxylase-like metal-dependent hydrolase (beta-lactamase superfamily II)
MLEIETIGPVTKIKMARAFFGRPFYFTTAYWVDGLLIDTGCAHTEREILQALAGLPVERAVNTHSHEDHIGANAALQEKRSAEIWAHHLALPVLADPRGNQPLQPYRRIFWGYPRPSDGQPIGETVETDHYCFQAIHTPGHSPDHICLYEPDEGWLFSGDLYIGSRDRALRADYNICAIIDSLKKIAPLEISRLFPGSGTVRENPGKDLLEKIDCLEETSRRVRELHQRGLSPRQIARRILGPELLIAYVTLGHFSGKCLVNSYLRGMAAASLSEPVEPAQGGEYGT